MVVFAIGLVGGLETNVAAITAQSQETADLPWVRWKACKACVSGMHRHVINLGKCRVLVRILVLCSPYVDVKSLRRWWCALSISDFGKTLYGGGVSLMAEIFGMLWTGNFRNCELMVAVPPTGPEDRSTHPTCQCGVRPQMLRGRRTFPDEGHRSHKVLPGASGPEGPEMCAVEFSKGDRCRQRFLCPWWTAKSVYCPRALVESGTTGDYRTCPPRWQTWSYEGRGTCNAACVAPALLQKSLANIDVGLVHLQSFWQDYRNHFQDCCLGNRGVAKHMQTILDHMEIAFWLPDIVRLKEPTQCHYENMRSLYICLKPDLERRGWPAEGSQVMPTIKQWNLNAVGVNKYYHRWWSRIHEAANKPESTSHASWRKIKSHEVRPAIVGAFVGFLCRQKFPTAPKKLLRCKVGSLITAFLKGTPPSFAVRSDEVEFDGDHSCYTMGALRTAKLRRRLVVLVSTQWECDQRAVTASLEHEPEFALDCYQINVCFCLARRFCNTEQPCEVWFGAMKYLYNPIHGMGTAALTQRLRQRASGVRGLDFDAEFTRKLAETLYPKEGDPRQQPRQGGHQYSRAVDTYLATERSKADQAGHPVLEAVSDITKHASQWTGRSGQMDAASYKHTLEEAILEPTDRKLAKRIQGHKRKRDGSAGPARLPFFAQNKSQWNADLDRLDLYVRRDPRAMEVARAHAKPVLPVPVIVQDGEPNALEQSSSSGTSSSSESSSTSGDSEEEKEQASAPRASLAEMDPNKVPWIVARSGQVVHLRIDLPQSRVCLQCRPQVDLKPGFTTGETMATADATGLHWCRTCGR